MATRKVEPSEQKRQKKKNEIFKHAMELIIKKGYHLVTVDEICRKVGISKGSFYYYYPSKDKIMMDFFFRNDQIYLKEYKETISQMDSAIEKLTAVTRIILTYIDEQGVDVLKTVYFSQIDPSNKKDSFSATKRPFYKITYDIVKEGQERGEFRRDLAPNEIALLFSMSIRGVSYEWCLRNGKFDFKKTAETMFFLILESMKAK